MTQVTPAFFAALRHSLGDDVALRPLRQFILEKIEGNPFFMEEIVQALHEQEVLTDRLM